jgi:hypothetical protein
MSRPPHRIRHYGLLASGTRADNIARVRAITIMGPPSANLHTSGRSAS